MSLYVPVQVRRTQKIRQALLEAAEEIDSDITVKEVDHLAEAVVARVYPTDHPYDHVLSFTSGHGRIRPEGEILSPTLTYYLTMVANGYTHPEIAQIIGRSKHTVENQVRKCIRVLGAENAIHAVALAMKWKILDDEQVSDSPREGVELQDGC